MNESTRFLKLGDRALLAWDSIKKAEYQPAAGNVHSMLYINGEEKVLLGPAADRVWAILLTRSYR